MDKVTLRQFIRGCKAGLSLKQMEEESLAVFNHIEQLQVFIQSNNILLYYSLPDELPTVNVINKWTKCKNIFLPRVNGDLLEVVPYDNTISCDNRFHIYEPQGQAVLPCEIDLIIVPAIALDKDRNRMGRGKGFYDRLLAETKAFTIGVAFDCQLVEQVPTEKHDIPLNAVITQSHHYGI